MEARILAVAALSLLLFGGAGGALAQTPGSCDIFVGSIECTGGGTGGGGETGSDDDEDGETPAYYWGAWGTSGQCPDGSPRVVRYLMWATGGYVEPWELAALPPGVIFSVDRVFQMICTEFPIDDLWDEVVEEIERLPGLVWETSPSASGITGLETWFWHSGPTVVGPIEAAWTHPPTGITYTLQGRGWVGEAGWATGDGAILTADADTWDDGAGVGGSAEQPAARHTYERTSATAGHASGYPVSVSLRWVGDWRWSSGGGWSPWQPMDGTHTTSASADYEVQQIIGTLHP